MLLLHGGQLDQQTGGAGLLIQHRCLGEFAQGVDAAGLRSQTPDFQTAQRIGRALCRSGHRHLVPGLTVKAEGVDPRMDVGNLDLQTIEGCALSPLKLRTHEILEGNLLSQRHAGREDLGQHAAGHQRDIVVHFDEVQLHRRIDGAVEEDAELDVASATRQGQGDPHLIPLLRGQRVVDETVLKLERSTPEAPSLRTIDAQIETHLVVGQGAFLHLTFGELEPGEDIQRQTVGIPVVGQAGTQTALVDMGVRGVANAKLDAHIALLAHPPSAPAHPSPVDSAARAIRIFPFETAALGGGKLLHLLAVATKAGRGSAHVDDLRVEGGIQRIPLAKDHPFRRFDVDAL